jgi:hypothetical protein
MAELNAAARKRIPKAKFALPGGGPGGADAYPIQDKAHAVAALARVDQNGTPAEKAKVRAAVAKAYPGLPSSKGTGGSSAAKASPKAAPAKTAGKRAFPGAAAPFTSATAKAAASRRKGKLWPLRSGNRIPSARLRDARRCLATGRACTRTCRTSWSPSSTITMPTTSPAGPVQLAASSAQAVRSLTRTAYDGRS